MRQKQHILFIAATVVGTAATTYVHGFSVPHIHAVIIASRGGGENEDLDAYIEQLVASVEDSDEDASAVASSSPSSSSSSSSSPNAVVDAVDDDSVVSQDKKEVSDEDTESAIETSETSSKPVVDEATVISNSSVTPSTSSSTRSAVGYYPTRRPNGLYRFLLNQGRIGHYIVMTLIWMAEFIQTYIPTLFNFYAWLLKVLFGIDPSDAAQMMRRRYDEDGIQDNKKVHDQYVAFADTRALRGKQRTKVSQKADQEAAEQLRRLGNVDEARYRLLSLDFMRKHGLGPYQTNFESDDDSIIAVSGKDTIQDDDDDNNEDEEEDVNWVVEALTKEETKKAFPISQPKVDVGIDTTGVTVGVEFSIGSTSSRKKRKLIRAATTTVSSTKSRKALKRVSDKEGGVLGRIRDFSANNVMSRSLLGAYPGDALPPSEAASANGVEALATKYGYGDWSDGEEDDNSNEVPRPRRKRRKVSSSGSSSTKNSSLGDAVTKRKRRTPSSSLAMEFNMEAAEPFPQNISKRRNSSSTKASEKLVRLPTERFKEKEASMFDSSSMESNLKEKVSSISLRENASKRVQLPMERLKEKEVSMFDSSSMESNLKEKVSSMSSKEKPSKMVRLPTERLKEKEASLAADADK